MKRKLPQPDLFSQPMSGVEQDTYSRGWNDAIRHIADIFDQFPFPIYGEDLLKLLKPEETDSQKVTSSEFV